jgi:phage terminase large subunit
VQRTLDQSVKQLIDDKIASLGVKDYFRSTDKYIETRDGGLIIFEGMQNHTADSIKSLEAYDIAWVEEAQSLSQRSLNLLYPTIREPGSELWFSWNPTSDDDPVDSYFRNNDGDPDFCCVEVTYADNPWFPDELRRDMERDRRRDPDKYAHIWLGGYQKNTEARVFKNWRIGDAAEFSHDPPRYYYGADWGFAIDPTVLVRCYIVNQTLYVDREVYRVGCKIEDTPALFDMLDNKRARQWPITADSARPETIAHMRDHGYPRMVPAKKGADSVKEGVEFLKNYDIVVHPDCRNTVDELAKYSYLIDKKTEQVLPRLSDKKNHVIDALRYAVESLRRAVEPPTINVLHIPAPHIEKMW